MTTTTDWISSAKPVIQLAVAFMAFTVAGDVIERVTPKDTVDVAELEVGFDPEDIQQNPQMFQLLKRLKAFREQGAKNEEDHYEQFVKYMDRLLHLKSVADDPSRDPARAATFYTACHRHLEALKRLLRNTVDYAELLVKFETIEQPLEAQMNEIVEEIGRISSR